MANLKNNDGLTLAQFVSQTREERGFSQKGLADYCNLTLEEVRAIEDGTELFLPQTVRQKLTKGLRVSLNAIKSHERAEDFNLTPNIDTEHIKDIILEQAHNPNIEIKCPVCGEILITRIAKLYDLEDNLMLHPKARCPKCPFQIK